MAQLYFLDEYRQQKAAKTQAELDAAPFVYPQAAPSIAFGEIPDALKDWPWDKPPGAA